MQPRLAHHHCACLKWCSLSPSIFHGCASSAPPLGPGQYPVVQIFRPPSYDGPRSLAPFACGRNALRRVLLWCAASLSASPLPCGSALPAAAICYPASGEADMSAPVIDVAAPVAAHVRRTLPRTVKGLAAAQHGQRAAAAAAVSVQVVHERQAGLRAHAGSSRRAALVAVAVRQRRRGVGSGRRVRRTAHGAARQVSRRDMGGRSHRCLCVCAMR